MNKLLSIKQYADLHGISRQHVLSYASKNKKLNGVKSAKLIGRIWVLTVSSDYIKEKIAASKK